jgi:hypothetical protein
MFYLPQFFPSEIHSASSCSGRNESMLDAAADERHHKANTIQRTEAFQNDKVLQTIVRLANLVFQ